MQSEYNFTKDQKMMQVSEPMQEVDELMQDMEAKTKGEANYLKADYRMKAKPAT